MKTVTDFPRKVVVHDNLRIPMPDGIKLAARLWLPEDADTNPVPTILEHLPYRKNDGTIARDELTHPYIAGHGYACLRVDMRGNGDSEGLMFDEYEQQEWEDAIAVMDWVAAQPWSTGDWGMMGISWGGFNALQVAALRPKGLKAVISLCSTSDRYADDIHYKGGSMLGENLGWAAQMLAYSSRPPDPLFVGENWREMWLKRLESQPFLLETWLEHQTRDAYWKHGSICEDWDAVDVPVLSIGGWHDGYRNTPAALVRNLKTAKAIVGPWNHKYPHFAGPEPRIGFCQEALRWWDRWLKGKDTGVEDDPRERLYVMDTIKPERWVAARPGRWVGLEGDSATLHLPFIREPTPVKSPQHCGAAGGEYFPFAFGPELPADQTADDALSACFDLDTATEDTLIVGAPAVDLTVIPNGTTGQLAVRLCDLRPDGTSALIAHGFLNLTHHKSHEYPSMLTPGEPIEITVSLDQCAYRLPMGHRLRVAISTAYWPFLWPDPENAGVTLTRGSLRLPVRQAPLEQITFPEPEGARPWQHDTLHPAEMTRKTYENRGHHVTDIYTDNGQTRDSAHGLTVHSFCRELWGIRPDDPLSAEAEFKWATVLRRDDWQVRTLCDAYLTADATHWRLRAKISAFENMDDLIFERDFKRSIPRDHL